MATPKYCPRCGRLGVEASTATQEIYVCSGGVHGAIYSAPKPIAIEEEAAAAPAAEPEAPAVRQPKALN